MVLVEQAYRHQEQPGAKPPGRRDLVFDIGLFDGHLAAIAGRGHRMLDLELGNNLGLVVEAVLVAQHEAHQVGLGVAGRLARPVVVDFAVAAQHGGRLGRPAWRSGGGQGWRSHCQQRRHGCCDGCRDGCGGGRCGGLRRAGALLLQRAELGFELGQFGGHLVEPAHQLGLGGGLRLRGWRQRQQGEHGHQGQRFGDGVMGFQRELRGRWAGCRVGVIGRSRRSACRGTRSGRRSRHRPGRADRPGAGCRALRGC